MKENASLGRRGWLLDCIGPLNDVSLDPRPRVDIGHGVSIEGAVFLFHSYLETVCLCTVSTIVLHDKSTLSLSMFQVTS
jgi:hypothetical protein